MPPEAIKNSEAGEAAADNDDDVVMNDAAMPLQQADKDSNNSTANPKNTTAKVKTEEGEREMTMPPWKLRATGRRRVPPRQQ